MYEFLSLFTLEKIEKKRKWKKGKIPVVGPFPGRPIRGVLVPSPKQSLAPKTAPKWIPPSTEITKINVDAAVSRNKEQGVATAFCRDSIGNYLGALLL
jgi:hypothetical protein